MQYVALVKFKLKHINLLQRQNLVTNRKLSNPALKFAQSI